MLHNERGKNEWGRFLSGLNNGKKNNWTRFSYHHSACMRKVHFLFSQKIIFIKREHKLKQPKHRTDSAKKWTLISLKRTIQMLSLCAVNAIESRIHAPKTIKVDNKFTDVLS